jgi:hypothetical protein
MSFRLKVSIAVLIYLSMTALVLADAERGGVREEEMQLIAAVHRQVEAMNQEDLGSYMEAMHPKSPIFDRYKMVMEQLFTVYDLSTRAENIKVLSVDKDYAIVRLTLSKRKIQGRAHFSDVSVDSLWVYRRAIGAWLLWWTLSLSA